MKVLIDIPEDYLNDIRKERQTTLWRYAIANGKALSYMTNGDMIKAMFPNIESRLDEKTGIILVKWTDGTTKTFKASWWNAPYKKEVEE